MRFLLAMLLSGCMVPHKYFVDEKDLGLLPIPAVRIKDGAHVRLRTDTIDLTSTVRPASGPLTVVARAKSRMVTAGSLMTFIGSAISIAGTIVFFVGYSRNDATLMKAGYISAPSAEPIMITGTVLWVLGARSHPQEIP